MIANYVCPNCFEKQSLSGVEYICTNTRKDSNCTNAIEGKPFKPVGKSKHPKCDCGQALTTKVCPMCKFELPMSIGTSKDYPVAIIGAKESGKSNYVAVLINQLKNDVGRAFNCSLYATGGDKTIKRYNSEFYEPLFRRKMCVKGTDAGRVEPLIYSLLFNKKGFFGKNKAVSLTFFDTAGENLNSQVQMSTYNRYLSHAAGIILLLDPLQLPYVRNALQGKIPLPQENEDTNSILSRAITVIRNENKLTDLSKKIDIPIAIAFTKIDAVDELIDAASCLKNESSHIKNGFFSKIDFNDSNMEMQSLVDKWFGPELYQQVSTQFTKFAFFGLSALGSNPDESMNIPRFRPFRVTDPFLWILSENGVIKSQ